jgi:hypothetical protein
MSSRRRRRRLRVLLLRGLRLTRRHYLSLVSAVIVAVVFGVALTNASFELDAGVAAQPEAVAPSAPLPAATASPVPTPAPTEEPAPKVVYYIVESVEQAWALAGARRADAVYFAAQGLPPFPPTSAYYVMYESREEELEGQRLLHELAYMAPNYGIDFYVVDLRQ